MGDDNIVHSCDSHCPPWHRDRPPVRRSPHYTVDVHCHMLAPAVEEMVAATPQKQAENELLRAVQGAPSLEHNLHEVFPTAFRKMSTLQERLADMDRTGVDLQVVSPSPTQYYYWADRDLAARIVRAQNEYIAAQCELAPQRLRAMGAVALQHPELAIEQMTYCVRELGMVGVEVSSLVNGQDLSEPGLRPFWAAAESLGCVVFLHPLGTSLGARLAAHYLSNSIGQPAETTVALAKLIHCGLFDQHPALKLLAAHGGGYLAANAARLDHAWRVRPEARTCRHRPSDYLRRIFFDTVVYEPQALENLVGAVGASQVLAGSDYPYDMGIDDLHALTAASSLSEAQRAMILGQNACRLFGLVAHQAR